MSNLFKRLWLRLKYGRLIGEFSDDVKLAFGYAGRIATSSYAVEVDVIHVLYGIARVRARDPLNTAYAAAVEAIEASLDANADESPSQLPTSEAVRDLVQSVVTKAHESKRFYIHLFHLEEEMLVADEPSVTEIIERFELGK